MVPLLETTFSKWNKIWTCTIVLHWSQSRSQSHETIRKSLGISLSLDYKSQSQSRSRKNNFQSLSLSLGLEKTIFKVSVSVSVSKNQLSKSQYQSQYQKSWSRRPLVWMISDHLGAVNGRKWPKLGHLDHMMLYFKWLFLSNLLFAISCMTLLRVFGRDFWLILYYKIVFYPKCEFIK